MNERAVGGVERVFEEEGKTQTFVVLSGMREASVKDKAT